MSNHVI